MATAKATNKRKLYLNWARSVLCEEGIQIQTLSQFQDAGLLAQLIDALWPQAQLQVKLQESSPEANAVDKVALLLQYLTSNNIKHSITAQGVAEGNVRSLLDLLWLIILHFSIHTPKLNAFQRNVKLGKRMVLNWCREVLPQISVDHLDTLVNNICTDCVLIDLIANFCSVRYDSDTTVYLQNCLAAAEEQLGINKDILEPEAVLSKTVEEETLLIYLTLLRCKVTQQDTSSPHARELKAVATRSHRHAIPLNSLKLDPVPLRVGTCTLPPLPQCSASAPLPDCESTTLGDSLASHLLQPGRQSLAPLHPTTEVSQIASMQSTPHPPSLPSDPINSFNNMGNEISTGTASAQQLPSSKQQHTANNSIDGAIDSPCLSDTFSTCAEHSGATETTASAAASVNNDVELLGNKDSDFFINENKQTDLTATQTDADKASSSSVKARRFRTERSISLEPLDCPRLTSSQQLVDNQISETSSERNSNCDLTVHSDCDNKTEDSGLNDSSNRVSSVENIPNGTASLEKCDEGETTVEVFCAIPLKQTQSVSLYEEIQEAESREESQSNSDSGCEEYTLCSSESGTVDKREDPLLSGAAAVSSTATMDSVTVDTLNDSRTPGFSVDLDQDSISYQDSLENEGSETELPSGEKRESYAEDVKSDTEQSSADQESCNSEEALPDTEMSPSDQQEDNLKDVKLDTVLPSGEQEEENQKDSEVESEQLSGSKERPDSNKSVLSDTVPPSGDQAEPVITNNADDAIPGSEEALRRSDSISLSDNDSGPGTQDFNRKTNSSQKDPNLTGKNKKQDSVESNNVIEEVLWGNDTITEVRFDHRLLESVDLEPEQSSGSDETQDSGGVLSDTGSPSGDQGEPVITNDTLDKNTDDDDDDDDISGTKQTVQQETVSGDSLEHLDSPSASEDNSHSETQDINRKTECTKKDPNSTEKDKRQDSVESNNAIDEVLFDNDTITEVMFLPQFVDEAGHPNMDELRINLVDVCGADDDDDDIDGGGAPAAAAAAVDYDGGDEEELLDDVLTPTSDGEWLAYSMNSLIASANEGAFPGLADSTNGLSQSTIFNRDRKVGETILSTVAEHLMGDSEESSGDLGTGSGAGSQERSRSGSRSDGSTESVHSPCSSPSAQGDELLDVLDAIDQQGQTMQSELELAYSMEAEVQADGFIGGLHQEIQMLRVEKEELERQVEEIEQSKTEVHKQLCFTKNANSEFKQKSLKLVEENRQLQTRVEELERKHAEDRADFQDKRDSLRDVATITSLPTNDAKTQTEFPNPVITTTEDIKELLSREEGAEKWRDLSMVSLCSDPTVQVLQRSLGNAVFEYELTQSKLSKNGQDVTRRVEELTRELDQVQSQLTKSEQMSEVLQVKSDGDLAEMDLLKDKVAALEKSLAAAQLDKQRLTTKLRDAEELRMQQGQQNCSPPNSDPAQVAESQMKQNSPAGPENSTSSMAHSGDLEASLATVQSEKQQLEAEVVVLRDQYGQLKKAMLEMEKLLQVPGVHVTMATEHRNFDNHGNHGNQSTVTVQDSEQVAVNGDLTSDSQDRKKKFAEETAYLQKRLETLKQHALSAPPPRKKSQETDRESVHSGIINLSESVLKDLKDSGDIKEEKEPALLVHWQDVRHSIAQQLHSEGKDDPADLAAGEHNNIGQPPGEEHRQLSSLPVHSSLSSQTVLPVQHTTTVEPQVPLAFSGQSVSGLVQQMAAAPDLTSLSPAQATVTVPKPSQAYPTPATVYSVTQSQSPQVANGYGTNSTTAESLSSNYGNVQGSVPVTATVNSPYMTTTPAAAAAAMPLGGEGRDVILNGTTTAPTTASQPGVSNPSVRPGPKYRTDYSKMDAEFQELRKRRLALLIQAYTGRTDVGDYGSTPLSLPAVTTTDSTVPAVPRGTGNSHLGSAHPMTAVTAVSSLPSASFQNSTSSIPGLNRDRGDAVTQSHAESQKLIKDRLQVMRERLAQNDDDLYGADDLDDDANFRRSHFEENVNHARMETKKAVDDIIEAMDIKSERLFSAYDKPRRQIYPHKRNYQPVSSLYETDSEATEDDDLALQDLEDDMDYASFEQGLQNKARNSSRTAAFSTLSAQQTHRGSSRPFLEAGRHRNIKVDDVPGNHFSALKYYSSALGARHSEDRLHRSLPLEAQDYGRAGGSGWRDYADGMGDSPDELEADPYKSRRDLRPASRDLYKSENFNSHNPDLQKVYDAHYSRERERLESDRPTSLSRLSRSMTALDSPELYDDVQDETTRRHAVKSHHKDHLDHSFHTLQSCGCQHMDLNPSPRYAKGSVSDKLDRFIKERYGEYSKDLTPPPPKPILKSSSRYQSDDLYYAGDDVGQRTSLTYREESRDRVSSSSRFLDQTTHRKSAVSDGYSNPASGRLLTENNNNSFLKNSSLREESERSATPGKSLSDVGHRPNSVPTDYNRYSSSYAYKYLSKPSDDKPDRFEEALSRSLNTEPSRTSRDFETRSFRESRLTVGGETKALGRSRDDLKNQIPKTSNRTSDFDYPAVHDRSLPATHKYKDSELEDYSSKNIKQVSSDLLKESHYKEVLKLDRSPALGTQRGGDYRGDRLTDQQPRSILKGSSPSQSKEGLRRAARENGLDISDTYMSLPDRKQLTTEDLVTSPGNLKHPARRSPSSESRYSSMDYQSSRKPAYKPLKPELVDDVLSPRPQSFSSLERGSRETSHDLSPHARGPEPSDLVGRRSRSVSTASDKDLVVTMSGDIMRRKDHTPTKRSASAQGYNNSPLHYSREEIANISPHSTATVSSSDAHGSTRDDRWSTREYRDVSAASRGTSSRLSPPHSSPAVDSRLSPNSSPAFNRWRQESTPPKGSSMPSTARDDVKAVARDLSKAFDDSLNSVGSTHQREPSTHVDSPSHSLKRTGNERSKKDLTSEQRKYADDLIDRYSLQWEHQQMRQVAPPSDYNSNKKTEDILMSDERRQNIRDIMDRYAKPKDGGSIGTSEKVPQSDMTTTRQLHSSEPGPPLSPHLDRVEDIIKKYSAKLKDSPSGKISATGTTGTVS